MLMRSVAPIHHEHGRSGALVAVDVGHQIPGHAGAFPSQIDGALTRTLPHLVDPTKRRQEAAQDRDAPKPARLPPGSVARVVLALGVALELLRIEVHLT